MSTEQHSKEQHVDPVVESKEVLAASAEEVPTTGTEEEKPIAEFEEGWGFTYDELQTTAKVVNILFNNPGMFANDPHLLKTNLHVMVSRERSKKKEAKEVRLALKREKNKMIEKAKREADDAIINKTMMKKERDAALNALLLPSADQMLMLTDKPSDTDTTASPSAAASPVEKEDGAAAAAAFKKEALQKVLREDFVSAVQLLKFLECELSRPKLNGVEAEWEKCTVATAKFYRIFDHEFGSAMPPPLWFEEVLPSKVNCLLKAAKPLLPEEAECGKDGETSVPPLSIEAIVAANLKDMLQQLLSSSATQTWKDTKKSFPKLQPFTNNSKNVLPWNLQQLDAIRCGGEKVVKEAIDGAFGHVLDFNKKSVEEWTVEMLSEATAILTKIRLIFIPEASNGCLVNNSSELPMHKRDELDELTGQYLSLIPHVKEEPITTEAILVEHEVRVAAMCDIVLAAVLRSAAPFGDATLFVEASNEEQKKKSNDQSDDPEGQDDGAPDQEASGAEKKDAGTKKGKIVLSYDIFYANKDKKPVRSCSWIPADPSSCKLWITVHGAWKRDGKDTTGIVAEDGSPTDDAATPVSEGEFRTNRVLKCHICKEKYRQLHLYYYSMCPPCGEYNYDKRLMARDLRGKVVLLTGCRIKIGYAMALSLLRCGATLVGTTRFSHDAVARFMQEKDYDVWSHRLHLYSLDLRDMWMVTQFCAFMGMKFPKLFAIINNAAQTIARTAEYTAALREQEARPALALQEELCKQGDGTSEEWRQFFLNNSSVTVGQSLQLEHHPVDDHQPFEHHRLEEKPHEPSASGMGATAKESDSPSSFTQQSSTTQPAASPKPKEGTVTSLKTAGQHGFIYDRYDTQAEESDTRATNTWTMNMAEVQGSEAAEVMTINALSPFVLNAKLKPLLMNREGDAVKDEKRFIINVSAMEGQFYRFKQTTHPHTNMAKAALNMMTRTSAKDYVQDGIYMNSVDTGWITDEAPTVKKQRRNDGFLLVPLDEVDAAARCLDLIYIDSDDHGKFYKDFHTIPW